MVLAPLTEMLPELVCKLTVLLLLPTVLAPLKVIPPLARMVRLDPGLIVSPEFRVKLPLQVQVLPDWLQLPIEHGGSELPENV